MAKAAKAETTGAKQSLFYLDAVTKEKLRTIAFKEEKSQTGIVMEALTDYFTKYEKKNGAISVK